MINTNIKSLSNRFHIKRGMIFGLLIVTALLAFELFNYSTTDFALSDLLGDLKFLGVRWATILSIAFCGIDFAGIARLFTPEQGADEPAEVWYLFGAWMLAAVMNAMLTWWGVSIAILNHQTLGNAVVARETLLNVVPIFVAIMVWLIRVLIIGTISMAGDRLFSQAVVRQSRSSRVSTQRKQSQTTTRGRQRSIRPLNNSRSTPLRRGINASSFNPSPKPDTSYMDESSYEQLEPTYSPVSFDSNRRENSSRQARF
jgi:hypothetical protein